LCKFNNIINILVAFTHKDPTLQVKEGDMGVGKGLHQFYLEAPKTQHINEEKIQNSILTF
jgi:hypothetical protein